MRSSLAVLALIGAVTQTEQVQAIQKKHHHKHHKHSLAQDSKEDDDNSNLNPDANRETFNKAVDLANRVVAKQVATENTNVSNVAAANAKATAESNKLFTDVTKARVTQIHGDLTKRQWVLKNSTGNWAQTTPDENRTSYDNAVKSANQVVTTQNQQENQNVTTITDIHNKAASNANTLQNKVTKARVEQIRNEVPASRDSRGWQLVPPGTGHALAQNRADGDEAPAKEEAKAPAKEEAKAPAKEEAKAPAKEEAKAPAAEEKKEAAAPAKEEAKAPAKEEAKTAEKSDAAPAEAKEGDGKAAEAKEGEEKSAAPAKEAAKAPKGNNPENSYSEKAASLKEVLETVAEQRRFENESNADVLAAQQKYYNQSENQKNTVRTARKIESDGGLVHDTPMPIRYKLKGFGNNKGALAQEDPAPEEGQKQELPKENPENSYKEKAASLKNVMKTVETQQKQEAQSDKDVAAAQEKYKVQTANQQNNVRIDRNIQRAGGLDHREGYQRWPASSLMQRETPDESRKIFDQHVKEAAEIVRTEGAQENKRTTQIAKMDAQNVKDTFDEKARVRSGRVAMTRGGPRQRYSGGHNGPVGQEEKAAALAQESGSDASSESDSDDEEVNAKKHQALQQAIAKKQNKQSAREESSDSSSDSDSD